MQRENGNVHFDPERGEAIQLMQVKIKLPKRQNSKNRVFFSNFFFTHDIYLLFYHCLYWIVNELMVQTTLCGLNRKRSNRLSSHMFSIKNIEKKNAIAPSTKANTSMNYLANEEKTRAHDE